MSILASACTAAHGACINGTERSHRRCGSFKPGGCKNTRPLGGFMLCLACGAEMSLVQVTADTTMLVSGYEHHTWQCSSCSTVERRMTFTREKTATPTPEPTCTVLAKAAQPAPRATTPREAADDAERRAQFNRFWDSLLSVPSPSTSSEESSHVKAVQPVNSPAPTARDEPSGLRAKPEHPRVCWSWREFGRKVR
jgi:hypothetical protein